MGRAPGILFPDGSDRPPARRLFTGAAADQSRIHNSTHRHRALGGSQVLMAARIKKEARALDVPRTLPDRYVMEDQVGFLMRVAMQRHTSIFMSLMAHDLTQTQFAALAKLVEVGTCSQNQLGRLIYLDANTVKGVVDRLRMRKLVTIA